MPGICVIAEADPFITRLLLRFAEESGLKGIQTQVGQDVLEFARQDKPAVIILDPELPGKMRGWEVIRALRDASETCQIPLITCSWKTGVDVTHFVGDVQGNLQKPDLHYDDFVQALRQAGVQVPGNVNPCE
jgi:CheY-like chemotaxis protein